MPQKFVTFDEKNKVWAGITQPCVLNPEASLGQVVLNMLNRKPSAISQIDADTGVTVTNAELRTKIIRVAQNYGKMGYKKDDVISFAVLNHENVVPLVIGCFCIGAPANGLDPNFNKEEYAHLLKSMNPKLIFCEENNLKLVKQAAELVGLKPNFAVFGPGDGETLSVDEFLKETGMEATYIPPYLGDSKTMTAYIPCSSGTTGLSKGICLSHSQLIEINASIVNLLSGSVLYFTSLYWVSGVMCILRAIFDGFALLTTRNKFSSDVCIDIIEKYKPTATLLPCRYLADLLLNTRFQTADLSSIRMVVNSGSPLTSHLRNEFNKYLPNGKIGFCYGLSEMGGNVAVDFIEERTGSSGFLMSNMMARVVDDDDNLLGIGEKGELQFKHNHPFLGYYNNKEATDGTMTEDGWVKSGDIGYFDEDGFLFVIDRKKEVFKYQGYQIFPAEIEEIIEKHPDVSGVCVTCIPDLEIFSDLPVAVVMKKEGANITEEDLIEYTNSRVISDFKKLRAGVFFVDQFPLTASGKVQRKKLQQTAIAEYTKRKSQA